jgi:hypothetical protein
MTSTPKRLPSGIEDVVFEVNCVLSTCSSPTDNHGFMFDGITFVVGEDGSPTLASVD